MSSSSRASSSSSSSAGRGRASKSGRTKGGRQGDGGGWAEYGGYMTAKKQKLDGQFNTPQGCRSTIFEGVSIYINGYTKPSSDKLRELIMQHGGRYEQYLLKRVVTHIVATSLPNSKIHSLRDFKVVRPEWITDSIREGRQLSYAPYKLFRRQGNSLASFSDLLTRSTSTTSTLDPSSDLTIDGDSGNAACASAAEQTDRVTDPDDEDRGEGEKGGSCEMVDADSLIENGSPESMDDADDETSQLPSLSEESRSPPRSERLQRAAKVTQAGLPDPQTSSRSEKPSGQSGSLPSKSRSPAKAGDPKFLSEFYSHSRLHHISTWGAEFRAYVGKLQKESCGTFPGRERLRQFHQERSGRLEGQGLSVRGGHPQRVVMHVDMDCFFVSVGLLRHPHLRGKPVAVTHSRGKGMTQPLPGSDPAFEKSQWRRGLYRGRKRGKEPETTTAAAAEMERLDDDDDDDDDDDSRLAALMDSHAELDFMVSEGSTGKETFISMAEIASCSYEARKAGVKNGMFMGAAKQLCPDLHTIPYDFDGYNTVSKTLYDTVASYTHDIEAVSCDEMLVDCTDLLANTGASPEEFAELLRQDIISKTGCTASAGLGPNILLARLATRKAKPNGQFHLSQGEVADFIKGQSVNDLPGVGWSLQRKLSSLGVETCGQLQALTLPALQKEFGPKTGQSLFHHARGHDDRPIRSEKERKSVSAEINYGIRFTSDKEMEQFVEELSGEVSRRLQAVNMKARSVTVKVMVRRPDAPLETAKFMGHGICNNLSKSMTLPLATDDANMLGKEAVSLIKAMKVKAADLRGVGIQTHRLESAMPGSGVRGVGKGNQSILNFAVSRPPPPEQQCVPRTATGREEEEEGKDALEENSEGQRSCDIDNVPPLPCLPDLGGQPSANQKTVPPLPCLPELNPQPHSDRDFLLSPSQVDREVLKELPADIRRQIEQEMRHAADQGEGHVPHAGSQRLERETRSQKRRRDSNEPGCSHWLTPTDDSSNDASQGKKDGGGGGGDGGGTAAGSGDSLPLSFSQIDPDVLRELPADIQQQLQQELTTSRSRRSSCRTSAHSVRGDEETTLKHAVTCVSESPPQSPSSLSGDLDRGHDGGRDDTVGGNDDGGDDRGDGGVCTLPNLSQLDPDCVNALPSDLQAEIRAAYARQPSLPSHHTSPSKLQPAGSGRSRGRGHGRGRGRGRGRGGKGSPVFKVPQGRPVAVRKEGRPPPLLFEATLQASESQHAQSAAASSSSSTSTATTTSAVRPVSPEPAVNLCGAVTLLEVRTLLAEWLESTTEPQGEDVEVMVTYLGQLVMDRSLDHVDRVLHFLHRKIVQQERLPWQPAWTSIITHTQDLVKAAYGCQLKTAWISV